MDGGVISVADAKRFGKFLGAYNIRVRKLSVWHYDGEHWRRDDPAGAVIQETAGSAALSSALAPITAPVGVPVMGAAVMALGPFAVLGGLLAALAGTLWAQVKLRENASGVLEGVTLASMIEFEFQDVTNRRQDWAEALCHIYGSNQGWRFGGWRASDQMTWANKWVRTKPGLMPRPWKTGGSGPMRLRRSIANNPKNEIMGQIADEVDQKIRDEGGRPAISRRGEKTRKRRGRSYATHRRG